MEEIEFGKVDIIERIFSLYPTINIKDLVQQFLIEDRNNEIEEFEEDGIDDNFGYMMNLKYKNGTKFYSSFSDYFISLDNSDKVVIDFTWINLLHKKLRAKSNHEANDYLISINNLINNLEDNNEHNLTQEQIKIMREKLQSVAFNKYTKDTPILSEEDKIILMQEYCD